MKVKSKDLNFSKATPTKVSDMKDGEMLVTEAGIYGRVGNQILTALFPLPFFYDEFDDASFDPRWSYQSGSGITFVEQNDRVEVTVNSGGYGSKGFLFEDISFDAWGIIEFTAHNTVGQQYHRFYVQDTVNFAYVAVEFIHDHVQDWYEVKGNFWHPGGSGFKTDSNIPVVDDKLWCRVRYRPELGDNRVMVFYATSDPFVGGNWIELRPDPTVYVTFSNITRFTLDSGNNEDTTRTAYFWNLTEIDPYILTTTTTTTTT